MTAPKYGYLAIGRAHRDVVTLADGTQLSPGKWDDGALYGWWQANLESASIAKRAEADAAWEDHVASYVASCHIEPTEKVVAGGGRRGTKVTVDRVTLTDGTLREFALGTAATEIEKEYRRLYTPPLLQGEDYASWRRGVTVQPIRTWAGSLYLDGDRQDLNFDPGSYLGGIPLQAILYELNLLSEQGWTVIHVSEDKGLFVGDDTDNDAYVTRVRYMLLHR